MQVILRDPNKQELELVAETMEEMKWIRDLWVNGIHAQAFDFNKKKGYAAIIITPRLLPDEK